MTTTRYPFAQMRERLRGRDDVLDFAIGASTPEAPPELLQLVRNEPESALVRSDAVDLEQVQQAACAFMAREYAVDVDPSRILPAPGGRSALAAVIASLLAANDVVVHTDPAYPTFAAVASRAGVRVEPWALDPARQFEPDVLSVEGSLGAASMISMNFPNNPTGALLPDGLIADLGARLTPEAIIFNDATLGPLTYAGAPSSILSHAHDAGTSQPLLELHSIGKLIGLLGVPLSFLVGTADVVDRVRVYTDYVWAPPSRLQFRLAAQCLNDPESLHAARERSRTRMSRLIEVLGRIGLSPFTARSGFYVLCPVPSTIGGQEVGRAQDAADALFERFSLAVMAWDGPGGGYLRMSSLYKDDAIDALDALGDVR